MKQTAQLAPRTRGATNQATTLMPQLVTAVDDTGPDTTTDTSQAAVFVAQFAGTLQI